MGNSCSTREKAEEPKATEKGPANPKRFKNADDALVQEALDGLIWSTPNLGRLDAYPDIKVVYRTDFDKSKVSLISGGGAGHEPMHGGFVGKGMLTAAISGETFASPTIDAVLSAILQVTGPKGCLLIIKNYTGDRLNFSLAAERARNQFGLNVECVITKDDVATVGERGVAGTLFVHKIAGAAAEAGQSLEEVKAKAVEVIDNSATMGVSFSSVRRLKPEMIEPDKMEVGLGIHGEPGASVQDLAPSAKVVDTIMENVMASERMKAPAPEGYACLVNNLGSVPPVEMCIVTNDLMKSKWSSNVKLLIGPAQLCTSLDMNGISLSLLRLTPTFKELLCASTDARSWPAAVVPAFPALAPATTGLDPLEKHSPSSNAAVAAVIEKICSTLIDSKVFLDDLDSKVGDADCGSTMALASRNVLDMKDKLPQADPTAFCQCLGAVLGKTMGGSSGVLMAILWSAMATSFEKSGKKSWEEHGPTAFMDGLKAMMAAGGAEPGYRTMLDALVPAAEALQRGEGFQGAKAAAEEGALKTMSMAPRAGRSENVPKSVWEGVPDPGAKAVALAFGALA